MTPAEEFEATMDRMERETPVDQEIEAEISSLTEEQARMMLGMLLALGSAAVTKESSDG